VTGRGLRGLPAPSPNPAICVSALGLCPFWPCCLPVSLAQPEMDPGGPIPNMKIKKICKFEIGK